MWSGTTPSPLKKSRFNIGSNTLAPAEPVNFKDARKQDSPKHKEKTGHELSVENVARLSREANQMLLSLNISCDDASLSRKSRRSSVKSGSDTSRSFQQISPITDRKSSPETNAQKPSRRASAFSFSKANSTSPRAMTQLPAKLSKFNFSSLRRDTLSSKIQDNKPSFNDYSRRSSTFSVSSVWEPSMGPRIVWTLKKSLKSMEDAEYIYNTIKNFEFFSRFISQNLEDVEDGAILQLCKQFKYEQVSGNKYVFQEGDASNDKLYIILSGKVSVILRQDKNVFVTENLRQQSQTNGKDLSQSEKKDVKERLATATLFESQSSEITESQTPKHKLATVARTIVKFSSLGRLFRRPNVEKEDNLTARTDYVKEAQHLREIARKCKQSSKRSTLTKEQKDPILRILQKKHLLKKNESSAEDLNLVELATKYGLANKELLMGAAFGEKALTSKDEKRSATILANEDCEFLVLMKADYLNIVGRYNKENRLKLNFLKKNLPYVNQITSSSILEDYLYIFNTELLKRGNKVTEENKPGQRVYLLVEGQCRLEKCITVGDQTIGNSKSVFISHINAPAVLGEEILFEKKNERQYNYTVKVDSIDAKLYYAQASALRIRFPKETVESLKEHYLDKNELRNDRIKFLESQSGHHVSAGSRVLNPRIKDIVSLTSKSCRNGFIVRPELDNTNEGKDKQGTRNPELKEKKGAICGYSRHANTIRNSIISEMHKTFNVEAPPAKPATRQGLKPEIRLSRDSMTSPTNRSSQLTQQVSRSSTTSDLHRLSIGKSYSLEPLQLEETASSRLTRQSKQQSSTQLVEDQNTKPTTIVQAMPTTAAKHLDSSEEESQFHIDLAAELREKLQPRQRKSRSNHIHSPLGKHSTATNYEWNKREYAIRQLDSRKDHYQAEVESNQRANLDVLVLKSATTARTEWNKPSLDSEFLQSCQTDLQPIFSERMTSHVDRLKKVKPKGLDHSHRAMPSDVPVTGRYVFEKRTHRLMALTSRNAELYNRFQQFRKARAKGFGNIEKASLRHSCPIQTRGSLHIPEDNKQGELLSPALSVEMTSSTRGNPRPLESSEEVQIHPTYSLDYRVKLEDPLPTSRSSAPSSRLRNSEKPKDLAINSLSTRRKQQQESQEVLSNKNSFNGDKQHELERGKITSVKTLFQKSKQLAALHILNRARKSKQNSESINEQADIDSLNQVLVTRKPLKH